MTNRPPYITSVYFTSLIRSYLKGHKTRREVLAEIGDLIPPSEGTDITQLIIAAATSLNRNFHTEIVNNIQPNTAFPTRDGVIHHLDALIKEEISADDLLEWATWYSVEDDELSAGIFDDLAVEYFCLDFLPAWHEELSADQYLQALQLFRMQLNDPLKEKIALLLLIDKEKQNFLFFLRSFLQQPQSADILDSYLMKKFGMDRYSFPYMAELKAIAGQPGSLEALLTKAAVV